MQAISRDLVEPERLGEGGVGLRRFDSALEFALLLEHPEREHVETSGAGGLRK
jgi:hypothetical protein